MNLAVEPAVEIDGKEVFVTKDPFTVVVRVPRQYSYADVIVEDCTCSVRVTVVLTTFATIAFQCRRWRDDGSESNNESGEKLHRRNTNCSLLVTTDHRKARILCDMPGCSILALLLKMVIIEVWESDGTRSSGYLLHGTVDHASRHLCWTQINMLHQH
jgi:hypothetical protein